MKSYDVKCPICGTINHNLYLEETNGWMECEHCMQEVRVLGAMTEKKIPVYTGKQLTACITAVDVRKGRRTG